MPSKVISPLGFSTAPDFLPNALFGPGNDGEKSAPDGQDFWSFRLPHFSMPQGGSLGKVLKRKIAGIESVKWADSDCSIKPWLLSSLTSQENLLS